MTNLPPPKPPKLEDHPLAAIFPMLEDDSHGFKALVEDIKANGQQELILTYENKILDGRNRYRACQKLGCEPKIEPYIGSNPIGFVLSANLHRRHLNEGQRSMVAATLSNLQPGSNQHNKKGEGTSIEVAAALLNVSRASVERARQVLTKGDPSLVEAVQQGELSVTAASAQASRNASATNAPSQNGPDPNTNGNPGPNLSDKVDALAKSLIKKLKELKEKSGLETAIAAATKIVEALNTADLLEGRKKKA